MIAPIVNSEFYFRQMVWIFSVFCAEYDVGVNMQIFDNEFACIELRTMLLTGYVGTGFNCVIRYHQIPYTFLLN